MDKNSTDIGIKLKFYRWLLFNTVESAAVAYNIAPEDYVRYESGTAVNKEDLIKITIVLDFSQIDFLSSTLRELLLQKVPAQEVEDLLAQYDRSEKSSHQCK